MLIQTPFFAQTLRNWTFYFGTQNDYGPGCTRINFVHFCHTSEKKKCDRINLCQVQPMLLGKQQLNLQESRRLVAGVANAKSNPIGENEKN